MEEEKPDSKLKKSLHEEVVSYCDRASIIGANYFFSHFTIPERIFWVIAVIIMLVLASIEVNIALTIWNKNPTVTITDSIAEPIDSIQFPTVTICPDFTPDKNGFVRDMLNLLKYQCDGRDACPENDTIRIQSIEPAMKCKDVGDCWQYSTWSDPSDHDLRDLVTSATSVRMVLSFPLASPYANGKAFIEDMLEKLRVSPNTELEADFWSGLWDVDSLLLFPLHRAYQANLTLKVEQLLTNKLKAFANNYDIFDYLNITKTYLHEPVRRFFDMPWDDPNYQGDVDDLEISSQEYLDLVRLAYLVLSMPLPGEFGTIHFNFQKMTSSPDQWFCNRYAGGDLMLAGYYNDILDGMLKGEELGVAPSELSAILSPVPYYVDMQKYPRQFSCTAWNQQMLTQPDYGGCVFTSSTPGPDFFTMKNYFGKLLGPHLIHVMEIMFHCQLRMRPLDKSRYLRLSNVYGSIKDIEGYLKFPLNVLSETFHPTWTDYLEGGETTTYFWTKNSLDLTPKLFENRLNLNSTDADRDNTMKTLQYRYQYLQMLTMCTGPGSSATCQDRFQPVMTDIGICHAFNALDFKSTVINNTYTNIFQQIYEPYNSKQSILNNTHSGKAFQMFMVLDSHQSKIMDNLSGKFRVGISNIFGFMNLRDASIDVEVGFYTKVTLVPTQLTTSDAFRQHDVHTRQCRYTDENPDELSLFKFYSYSSCIYECRLRFSAKACGCTPWNYPQYGNDSLVEICDGPQSYCFDQSMDRTNKSECNCLPDCEDISFTVTSDKSNINYNQECKIPSDIPWGMTQRDVDLNVIIGEKIRHMEGEEFLFWHDRLQQNQSVFTDLILNNKYVRYVNPILTQDKCLQLLENDFALLSIEVSVPTMTTLKHDMAVDFFTKISNVGGTLGLFTGMGILSFVEIGFLLYRIIRTMCKPTGKNKAKK